MTLQEIKAIFGQPEESDKCFYQVVSAKEDIEIVKDAQQTIHTAVLSEGFYIMVSTPFENENYIRITE